MLQRQKNLLVLWILVGLSAIATAGDSEKEDREKLKSLVSNVVNETQSYRSPNGDYFLVTPVYESIRGESIPFYRHFWSRDGVHFQQLRDYKFSEKDGSLFYSCGDENLIPLRKELPAKGIKRMVEEGTFQPFPKEPLVFNSIYTYSRGDKKIYVVSAHQEFIYRLGNRYEATRDRSYKKLFVGPKGNLREFTDESNKDVKIEWSDSLSTRRMYGYSDPAIGTYYLPGLQAQFIDRSKKTTEMRLDDDLSSKLTQYLYRDMTPHRENQKRLAEIKAELQDLLGSDLLKKLEPSRVAEPCPAADLGNGNAVNPAHPTH